MFLLRVVLNILVSPKGLICFRCITVECCVLYSCCMGVWYACCYVGKKALLQCLCSY